MKAEHLNIAEKLSAYVNPCKTTVKPEYNSIWLDFMRNAEPPLTQLDKDEIRAKAFA